MNGDMSQQKQEKLLVCYATRDTGKAENCITHLEAFGFEVLDIRETRAGSPWKESFKNKMKAASRLVLLISADFITALAREDLLHMIETDVPPSLLERSLGVVIRACDYTRILPGTVMDVKVAPKWQVDDEFWLSVAQHIKEMQ